MGVNVNQTANDFTPELAKVATSLRLESRHAIPRPELAVAILRELNSDYERLKSGKFSEIADEWESFCTTLGRQIILKTGGREIRGRAEALNDDGSLLLRTEHGRLEPVIGGDVTLVK
ncbi:Bifunctional ligase/repressor BirA [bioreactor metagenome]|uniref:Bifunctional ligase/repressor BirA n=1 Tax=bioreactor metagenome TaxID=1076179 RepID=A0A645JK68_9ZZZZ